MTILGLQHRREGPSLERNLVAIYDAAVRGLVRVGSVITRAAAAVGAATLGVARTAVVGVASVAARVAVVGVAAAAIGAAVRPTIICGFCGFCVPFT